jgi:hypothetical protein
MLDAKQSPDAPGQEMTDVVALIDARDVPAVRGSYTKQNAEISN